MLSVQAAEVPLHLSATSQGPAWFLQMWFAGMNPSGGGSAVAGAELGDVAEVDRGATDGREGLIAVGGAVAGEARAGLGRVAHVHGRATDGAGRLEAAVEVRAGRTHTPPVHALLEGQSESTVHAEQLPGTQLVPSTCPRKLNAAVVGRRKLQVAVAASWPALVATPSVPYDQSPPWAAESP